jgi:hypothetical protein
MMKLNPLAEAAEVVHNRTHATTFIDIPIQISCQHGRLLLPWRMA